MAGENRYADSKRVNACAMRPGTALAGRAEWGGWLRECFPGLSVGRAS